MKISVGLLYSIQQFLDLVNKHTLSEKVFLDSYTLYLVSKPESIIQIAIRYEWIIINESGFFVLTQSGYKIINENSPEKKLRIQLYYFLVIEKPNWISTIHYGRLETSTYMPPNIRQCFDEAGLLSSLSFEVIEWWDEIGNISRDFIDKKLIATGRLGERLSIFFEKNRTGQTPYWQAIDSNFAGYDLISVLSKESEELLNIEVKTSQNQNRFYITKNEWQTALSSKNYLFYFWKIEPILSLYIFDTRFVESYVPLNTLHGVWETCQIRFSNDELSNFKVEHFLTLEEIKKQEI